MSTTPQRLGKYELQYILGKGTVGEVWKAHDLSTHRDVALKILYTDLQRSDPHFLTRFIKDSQVLVSLHHDALVEVYEANISRREHPNELVAYLASEYVESSTLAQYMQTTTHLGKIPALSEIVYLFTRLGVALDYAHQQGIVHGNLTPTNILLRKQEDTQFPGGEPVLSDLGLEQVLGVQISPHLPFYLSPEQAQNGPAQPRSDVYALGVILYELCTGVVPFQGESTVAILTQHIRGLPTPPVLINPKLPPALSEVILRALSKDPATRFAKASLLAAAIADASTMQSRLYIGEEEFGGDESEDEKSGFTDSSILGVAVPLPKAPASSGPLVTRPFGQLPVRRLDTPGGASNTGTLPRITKHLLVPDRQDRPTAQAAPVIPVVSAEPQTVPQVDSAQLQKRADILRSLPLAKVSSGRVAASAPIAQPTLPPVPMVSRPLGPLHPANGTASQLHIPTGSPYKAPRTTAAFPAVGATSSFQPRPTTFTSQLLQEQARTSHPPTMHFPAKRRSSSSFPSYALVRGATAAVVVLAVIIGTIYLLHIGRNGNNQAAAPTHPVVGHVFFQDDAIGQNAQLSINLDHISPPPAGKSYVVWLQDIHQQTQLLGTLAVRNGAASYLYQGDAQNINLLSLVKGVLVTREKTGGKPTTPGKEAVYQASLDAAIQPYLRNILVSTPGAPNNKSAGWTLLDTIRSMNDKTTSIVDTLDHDNALMLRQATRVIEMIDGSQYARGSGDLPAKFPSQLNIPLGLLSSPGQTGYLDLLDKQLDGLEKVSQHNTAVQMRIQHVKNALTNLQDWLQKMRAYDVQLLKATNFHDAATQSVALQLKQLTADAYTGRIVPPNTSPQPTIGSAGALQAYTEAQYLAMMDVREL